MRFPGRIRACTCLVLSCVVASCQRPLTPMESNDTMRRPLQDREEPGIEYGDAWQYQVLRTSFTTGPWTLSTGTRGELGLPIEAFLRLYARKDDATVCLRRPTDFRKLDGIRIDTVEDALAFVRLFTSPRTFYLFETPCAIDIDQQSDEECQGYGVLSPDVYCSLELAAPVVVQGPGHFTIARYVLSAARKGSAYEVMRLDEWVGADGGYRELNRTIIGRVAVGAVRVPMFE
jgi:hypothetical protein